MARLPYSTGSQVEHPKYGLGTVTSIDEAKIAIKFDDHGEKKFLTSIVVPNLKKSDRKAPVDKKAPKGRRKAAVVEIEEPRPRRVPKIRDADEDDDTEVKIDENDLDLDDADLADVDLGDSDDDDS